jgi:amino acid transporter
MAREGKFTKWLIRHGITNPRESLEMWLMTFTGLAVLFVVLTSLPALMITGLCGSIFLAGLAILALIVVVFTLMRRKPHA